MVKVKDVFEEIFVGINLSTCSSIVEKQEVYTFKKENITYNSILYHDLGYDGFEERKYYNQLLNKELIKVEVPVNVKEKYFINSDDIVISLKKPYKVFSDIIVSSDKIIATNNYVVLRKIDNRKYYVPYLTYYIENVGINGLLKQINKTNSELSLEDVKDIELPVISKEEQRKKYLKIRELNRSILEAQDGIYKILNEDTKK